MPIHSVALDIAWRSAAREAAVLMHRYIEPEHLLLGILGLGEVPELTGARARRIGEEREEIEAVLRSLGTDSRSARAALKNLVSGGTYRHPGKTVHRSVASRQCFSRAEQVASSHASAEVRCVHLLYAIVDNPPGSILSLLQKLGADVGGLKLRLADLMRKVISSSEQASPLSAGALRQLPAPAKDPAVHALTQCGEDLTQMALDGLLTPALHRRREMMQIIQILSKQTRNKVLLVGEPGVGKMTLVYGLACRIAEGKSLPGKRIIALNKSKLIQRLESSSDLENRLEKLFRQAGTHAGVILHLGELPTWISRNGAPAMIPLGILEEGCRVPCIATTTHTGYGDLIAADPAWSTRFQALHVEELGCDETSEILKQLKRRYESHHNVLILPDAIAAAAALADRYLPATLRLPGKALDLLDEACASARNPRLTVDPERAELDVPQVNKSVVMHSVSSRTGIPFLVLQRNESSSLHGLEDFLSERVVGQAEAIRELCRLLRLSAAEMKDSRRPRGVFLLQGPEGVGKSLLAESLGEYWGGTENQLIRLRMSEFQEAASTGRLLDGEHGQLTIQLRSRPSSVVLLQQIEKAHRNVLEGLAHLLERGYAPASSKVNIVRHALFFMTSNTPSPPPHHASAPATWHALDGMEHRLRDCLDGRIHFGSLSSDDFEKIAWKRLSLMKSRLYSNHRTVLDVAPEAVAAIARRGYAEGTGISGLIRCFDELLAEPLARHISAGNLRPGDRLIVSRDDDADSIRIVQSAETRY